MCVLICAGVISLAACDKAAPQAEGEGEVGQKSEQAAEQPEQPALSQDELAQLYIDTKARFEATEQLPEASFQEIKANFVRVANEAEDTHLRANASLALGTLHESSGDQRGAVSYYRQAAELLPEEVDMHMVLALALSRDQKWDEAIETQWKVVNMIPDDLMGWLLLGELHVKGGKTEEAAKVYGAYEMRRKGLLDGLTLKRQGEYVSDEAERAACAEALVAANDNGTSLGLMYALDTDPSPVVRERVAAIMGEQRMKGYRKLLENKLASEPNAEVKKAMEWAISEIDREPVETAPGPVPEELALAVEAQAKALEATGADAQPPTPDQVQASLAGGNEADPAGSKGEPEAAKGEGAPPAEAPADGDK